MASVRMSEVDARSSPLAAARSITGRSPLSMSALSQPAMAMYCSACPACVAVKAVSEPASMAACRRAESASPLSPEMAATVDIWDEKASPAPAASRAIPRSGAVRVRPRPAPTADRPAPMRASSPSISATACTNPDVSSENVAKSSPTCIFPPLYTRMSALKKASAARRLSLSSGSGCASCARIATAPMGDRFLHRARKRRQDMPGSSLPRQMP